MTWTTYGTWLPGDERGFVGYVRERLADEAQPADWRPRLGIEWVGGADDASRRVGGADDASRRVGGADDASRRVGGADDASRRVGGADDASRRVGGAASRRVHTRRVIHNVPGTPCRRDMPGLRLYARAKMKGKAVRLNQAQAQTFLAEACRTAAYRGWRLLAVAVMTNHVHLLVEVPDTLTGERLLQEFKSYSARALNEQFGRPASGTWWTRSGSKRRLPDRRAVWAAIRYVRNQRAPLVVWFRKKWVA